MLFYRAALPLSRQTLTFVSGLIRAHRRQVGSAWRKLNPGQQALLVLVYLRKGEPFAEIGAGFAISTTTVWRCDQRGAGHDFTRRPVVTTCRTRLAVLVVEPWPWLWRRTPCEPVGRLLLG